MSLTIETVGKGVTGWRDSRDLILTCTHCSRTEHEAGSCFQIVGYPGWQGDSPKMEGKGGGRRKHSQHVGTSQGRGGTARANAVQSGGISSGTTDSEGDVFVVDI